MVFIIVLVGFVVEGGVTRQPEEPERGRGPVSPALFVSVISRRLVQFCERFQFGARRPSPLVAFRATVDLQYVHDDAGGPAVHGPAVPLSANHLRSCTRAQAPGYFGRSASGPPAEHSLTQVLGRPAGVFDQPVLQFGKMEVADDYFGMLQTVVINQVLQLKADESADGGRVHVDGFFTFKAYDLVNIKGDDSYSERGENDENSN